MSFHVSEARDIALRMSNNQEDEEGLVEAFTQICIFLNSNLEYLTSQSRTHQLSTLNNVVIQKLASKYFDAYHRSDFPGVSGATPDYVVGLVMMEVFDYSQIDVERIVLEHQRAMSAENCVGVLLERYIDSVLRRHGWCWCCGNFVKAVDFIKSDQEGRWLLLQVKNRDNSENSSSSAIRNGTTIQKWFRTFSRTGATNWHNLPSLMQGYGLSEEGFVHFIRTYLRRKKYKRNLK